MANFTQWGNDLYTGKRSIDFVGKRKLWYAIAAVLIGLSILAPIVRGGFVFGIEFTGGNEFTVSGPSTTDQTPARDAVLDVTGDSEPRISVVGADAIRVQTAEASVDDTSAIRSALADAYGVPIEQVTASSIGPSWGQDITSQALRSLLIFLVVVSLFMAAYFRTWKMSVAAVLALVHDLILTIGVYGAVGFEVTPAAVIGFLTILGYSLYDTVVVFDKVRENTAELGEESTRTFGEAVNLAVNQTLVRSINTSIVAVLPVAGILFIGAFVLGAGTLRDIALALFIGTIVATYSTIFLAAPIYVHLREREPAIKNRDARVRERRAQAELVATPSGAVTAPGAAGGE